MERFWPRIWLLVISCLPFGRRLNSTCQGLTQKNWNHGDPVKPNVVHRDITAISDSEEGKRRLRVWGFVELDGVWTYRLA
jgi:hypothetical protein